MEQQPIQRLSPTRKELTEDQLKNYQYPITPKEAYESAVMKRFQERWEKEMQDIEHRMYWPENYQTKPKQEEPMYPGVNGTPFTVRLGYDPYQKEVEQPKTATEVFCLKNRNGTETVMIRSDAWDKTVEELAKYYTCQQFVEAEHATWYGDVKTKKVNKELPTTVKHDRVMAMMEAMIQLEENRTQGIVAIKPRRTGLTYMQNMMNKHIEEQVKKENEAIEKVLIRHLGNTPNPRNLSMQQRVKNLTEWAARTQTKIITEIKSQTGGPSAFEITGEGLKKIYGASEPGDIKLHASPPNGRPVYSSENIQTGIGIREQLSKAQKNPYAGLTYEKVEKAIGDLFYGKSEPNLVGTIAAYNDMYTSATHQLEQLLAAEKEKIYTTIPKPNASKPTWSQLGDIYKAGNKSDVVSVLQQMQERAEPQKTRSYLEEDSDTMLCVWVRDGVHITQRIKAGSEVPIIANIDGKPLPIVVGSRGTFEHPKDGERLFFSKDDPQGNQDPHGIRPHQAKSTSGAILRTWDEQKGFFVDKPLKLDQGRDFFAEKTKARWMSKSEAKLRGLPVKED